MAQWSHIYKLTGGRHEGRKTAREADRQTGSTGYRKAVLLKFCVHSEYWIVIGFSFKYLKCWEREFPGWNQGKLPKKLIMRIWFKKHPQLSTQSSPHPKKSFFYFLTKSCKLTGTIYILIFIRTVAKKQRMTNSYPPRWKAIHDLHDFKHGKID